MDRFEPPSPGWYPNPSGEPGTRYWDGHNWAAVNNWTNKRGRRPVGQLLGAVVAAVVGLLLFCWGAYDFNEYAVGITTTAIVTHCPGKGDCDGTWSVDGVTHTGSIERGFSTFPVGSSVDVRVSDGTAYTAHAWLPALVFGSVLLGGPLVSSLVWVFRRNRS